MRLCLAYAKIVFFFEYSDYRRQVLIIVGSDKQIILMQKITKSSGKFIEF